MNTHEIAIQNKLDEIINFQISDPNKKKLLLESVFLPFKFAYYHSFLMAHQDSH